jgi:hypothetical protein
LGHKDLRRPELREDVHRHPPDGQEGEKGDGNQGD